MVEAHHGDGMETDVKLKVRTDNLGFIADLTEDSSDIGIEGNLLQALKWVREIEPDLRPTKCLLIFLDDKDDRYGVSHFNSDMKISHRVALLRVISHWYERVLLGLEDH